MLLLVFSLNTLVGFACSMGMDLRSGTAHHKEKPTTPSVHIHEDGKKHQHQKQPANVSAHVHADGKKHTHTKKEPAKDRQDNTSKKNKDDCCNDGVLKIQQLDKNLKQNQNNEVMAPIWVAMLNTFTAIDIFNLSASSPQLATVRYLFPPPPNIRITIHRFQV